MFSLFRSLLDAFLRSVCNRSSSLPFFFKWMPRAERLRCHYGVYTFSQFSYLCSLPRKNRKKNATANGCHFRGLIASSGSYTTITTEPIASKRALHHVYDDITPNDIFGTGYYSHYMRLQQGFVSPSSRLCRQINWNSRLNDEVILNGKLDMYRGAYLSTSTWQETGWLVDDRRWSQRRVSQVERKGEWRETMLRQSNNSVYRKHTPHQMAHGGTITLFFSFSFFLLFSSFDT